MRRAKAPDVPALVEGVRAGDRGAVARAITLVESSRPDHRVAARELLTELSEGPDLGTGSPVVRVGISGVPGVGKSTFIEALGTHLTGSDLSVAVLAVDPSSVRTGGSVLGDKTRMAALSADPRAYIRPSPSAGTLGGVARATTQAMIVLEAAGYDVVLVETVGVGQSEVDIVRLADTVLVLLAPGAGDGVQAVKAGVLEIADVFVVNKADRDGAETTVRELKNMIALSRRELRGRRWRQPIVRTVAAQNQGAEEVLQALDEHRAWLESEGELASRRQIRARTEVEAIALRELRSRLADLGGGEALEMLTKRVVDRELDPFTAADELIRTLRR